MSLGQQPVSILSFNAIRRDDPAWLGSEDLAYWLTKRGILKQEAIMWDYCIYFTIGLVIGLVVGYAILWECANEKFGRRKK